MQIAIKFLPRQHDHEIDSEGCSQMVWPEVDMSHLKRLQTFLTDRFSALFLGF